MIIYLLWILQEDSIFNKLEIRKLFFFSLPKNLNKKKFFVKNIVAGFNESISTQKKLGFLFEDQCSFLCCLPSIYNMDFRCIGTACWSIVQFTYSCLHIYQYNKDYFLLQLGYTYKWKQREDVNYYSSCITGFIVRKPNLFRYK